MINTDSGGFIIPTTLENEKVLLTLLEGQDFEALYLAASDPLIWKQHPNKLRYQRPVFEMYFKGAMESHSAYLVKDIQSDKVIGCSRFYDFDKNQKSVCIGYTFLIRDYWGKSFNRSLKSVMLDHAFNHVESVIFHVGDCNIRSQKAMEKLGAENTGTMEMSYYGEAPHTNIIYQISRSRWQQH